MNEEELKSQINELIRDEIQETINEFVETGEALEEAGLGFAPKDEEKELKVNISNKEIDRIVKEYKKIKKGERSNLTHIKKLGLVDKHGRPLK